MDAEKLWNEFKNKNSIDGDNYSIWAFGDNPDLLLKLVKTGEKTATSSLYKLYNSDEELSKAGEYNIILNSKGQAECITKTTKVYLTKFSDITDAHAYKEGEGDKSLFYWKNIHERFFNECLTSYNEKITSDDLIVCEEFELVYKVD